MSENPCLRVVRSDNGTEPNLAGQKVFLTGRLTPLGARLWVRHDFVSRETKPLELIYAFQLPREGVMRRFRFSGPGWRVDSRLEARAEAAAAYEQAIDQGHTAAIATEFEDGVVNLSLGNIRPGEEVSMLMEMMAGVDLTADGYRFRFPFVLPPRYHAKARFGRTQHGALEMELPESFGGVLLPNWVEGENDEIPRVGFLLEAVAPGGMASIGSPSHPIEFQPLDSGGLRVLSRADAELPKGDLELEVRAREISPVVIGGIVGDRYELAAVVPVPKPAPVVKEPRRLVFLIDSSGSMEGKRIKHALQAVRVCLGLLEPTDQFAILAFESTVQPIMPKLSLATSENVAAARTALNEVTAGGGTELAGGLKAAIKSLAGFPGDILLMTDGEVAGTDSIVRLAARSKARVHALGIEIVGSERFLHRLSEPTGGTSSCMPSGGRIEAETMRLFESMGRILGVDSITIPGSVDVQIQPKAPKTAIAGSWLRVFASTQIENTRRLEVSFASESLKTTVELPVGTSADGETARLLRGARLVATSAAEDSPTIELQIIGREYGLANRAMSLVTVVERTGDVAGEPPKTRVLPSALPEATSLLSYMPANPSPKQAGRVSGGTPRALYNRLDSSFAFVEEKVFWNSLSEKAPPRFSRSFAEPAATKGKPGSTDLLKDPVDLAWSLLATLEVDGGLPATMPKTRYLRSHLLILLLVHLGGEQATSPFHGPLQKLEQFVQGSRVEAPSGTNWLALRRLMSPKAGNWAGHWNAVWTLLLHDVDPSEDEIELWGRFSLPDAPTSRGSRNESQLTAAFEAWVGGLSTREAPAAAVAGLRARLLEARA